jgi:rhodanese-related sulfurtransferase
MRAAAEAMSHYCWIAGMSLAEPAVARQTEKVSEMFRQFFQTAKLPEVTVTQTVDARVNGTHQLVDVRERDEWNEGHIPDARFIPLGELAVRVNELDPVRPVITICHSGKRSLVAVEILQRAGFTDVASMAGGMVAWAEARQPIER